MNESFSTIIMVTLMLVGGYGYYFYFMKYGKGNSKKYYNLEQDENILLKVPAYYRIEADSVGKQIAKALIMGESKRGVKLSVMLTSKDRLIIEEEEKQLRKFEYFSNSRPKIEELPYEDPVGASLFKTLFNHNGQLEGLKIIRISNEERIFDIHIASSTADKLVEWSQN